MVSYNTKNVCFVLSLVSRLQSHQIPWVAWWATLSSGRVGRRSLNMMRRKSLSRSLSWHSSTTIWVTPDNLRPLSNDGSLKNWICADLKTYGWTCSCHRLKTKAIHIFLINTDVCFAKHRHLRRDATYQVTPRNALSDSRRRSSTPGRSFCW